MEEYLFNRRALALASGEALQQAAEQLFQVIEAQPENADAYNNLGLLLLKLKQPDKAETYFFQAIKHKPDSPEVHNNLGSLYAAGGKSREARACFCQAIALNPNYAEAYRNLGLLLMRQNLISEAQACFCRAVELKPVYWQAHSVLGRIYLAQGQYAMGWEKYEWRLKSPKWHSLPFRQWQGEDLKGEKILLYYEQGFGDTLQFVRYAKEVAEMAAETTLWVQPVLQRLLGSSPGRFILHRGKQTPRGQYDFACPLMSLPRAFNTWIPQNVPYLRPDPDIATKWGGVLAQADSGSHYRVGVVWAGNPKHHNDRNRSIPFSVFQRLFAVPQIQWISLQVGRHAEDLTGVGPVKNYSGELTDFAETAGLIENLDLVITVDSAVAHLSGGMGKETWLLLPFAADWRWLMQREDSPWYPTVRIFRQREAGNWREVLNRVAAALRKLADSSGSKEKTAAGRQGE